MMRIIGGKYRGRPLGTVPEGLRPSSARLRETLFNIVSNDIRGAVWVEPFVGSGAVGIEAISRGAKQVILNDSSAESLQVVKHNLYICQVKERYTIDQMDVFVFLRKLDEPAIDFVFLDPPYQFGRYNKLLKTIAVLPGIQETTWIILETDKRIKLAFIPENLSVVRTLRVGNSHLVFLKLPKDRESDFP
ncbi:MAG: 16S rRNA (guanine(966)-N(2))-methyltransferase RsmD [Acidobacteriota bacterium]|nr:16S rRNA (guanine(966)-N(2))-methyltransferase RsmD [Acidobacteriota bacterium]